MQTKTIDDKVINNIAKAAKADSTLVHIIARGGKWIIKKHGGSRALGIYVTRGDAVSAAKRYIQNGKFAIAVVHDNMGRVDRTIK